MPKQAKKSELTFEQKRQKLHKFIMKLSPTLHEGNALIQSLQCSFEVQIAANTQLDVMSQRGVFKKKDDCHA